MFQPFYASDPILQGESFRKDEVSNNLIHQISGEDGSLCLKSADEAMLYAQTPGRRAWLWCSREVSAARREELLQELVGVLGKAQVPGAVGEPEVAAAFAGLYGRTHDVQVSQGMTMTAYHCPVLEQPPVAGGMLRQAVPEDTSAVAEYLAGFMNDAFGSAVEPASQLASAEARIGRGDLYLWIREGQPVCMANVSVRTPRHARIGMVYTPQPLRKKGYASALVAGVCSLLLAEGRVPVLYADVVNPDSNKVYRSLGFKECGTITEYDFGAVLPG
ncbi:GNAT family N-acetyltransferase [Paenibacillus tengchongensis]|uniref:GNAT family N-acetyltransferase n=1 Tax=Paenibacillus tengchongensis TaxID=2608684 RepID=UPI00124C2CBB|nr:GNAT family N-acetyltransferase [Paenibacillus tengchongensis]